MVPWRNGSVCRQIYITEQKTPDTEPDNSVSGVIAHEAYNAQDVQDTQEVKLAFRIFVFGSGVVVWLTCRK